MNCNEAKRRWHNQLDEGRQDGQLAEHVTECASCARYAAQMETIVGGLDELRIESELGTELGSWNGGAARYGRPLRWLRPSAIGRAAAVIVLCVGAYCWLDSGTPRLSIDSGVRQSGRTQSGPVQSEIGTTHGAPRVHAPTAARDALQEAATLGLTLRGASAQRFLAVARPTTSPDILMVRLYETRAAGHPGFKPTPH